MNMPRSYPMFWIHFSPGHQISVVQENVEHRVSPACKFIGDIVEIEHVLQAHPRIQDVAVIGLPSTRLGEIAAAVIKVKEAQALTEEEVHEFCKDLPRYRRPRRIIFDDVPRNPTGKIEKPKLRKKYQ